MAIQKKAKGAAKRKAAGASPKKGATKPAKPSKRRAAAAAGGAPPSKKAPKRAPKPRARKRAGAARPALEVEPTPAAPSPDPEGFFVARVRGEEEVRHAPHPMTEPPTAPGVRRAEPQRPPEGAHPVLPAYEEHLGELPSSYADDAVIALPRDPKTLFLYWDLSVGTVRIGFEGLQDPRVQLWVFAQRDEGWERVRVADFALESRAFYVNDLEPGRTYRVEIQALGSDGYSRRVGPSSNAVSLPPVGPSGIVDDRFVKIPWDLPLPRLLGPGRAGGDFPEDLRALLARLSDWGRFPDRPWGGSVAGGARPSSPASAPSWRPDASGEGEAKK